MPYASEGTLTTDIREVAIDSTWDTQTDWNGSQSTDNVEISNGVVRLAESTLPSSVVHRYDATELSLSDGDSGFVWADSEAGADLSSIGGPVYETGTMNGNPTVLYDGVDDAHEGAFSSGLNQPDFIVAAMEIVGTGSDPATRIWSSNDANSRQLVGVSSGMPDDWLVFAGNSFTGGPNYDNSPHILGVKYDGASTELRYDGASSATGDAGTNGLPGLRIGSDPDDSEWGNVRVGELVVMDSPTSTEIGEIENYLSDKWGVTI